MSVVLPVKLEISENVLSYHLPTQNCFWELESNHQRVFCFMDLQVPVRLFLQEPLLIKSMQNSSKSLLLQSLTSTSVKVQESSEKCSHMLEKINHVLSLSMRSMLLVEKDLLKVQVLIEKSKEH